MVKKIDLRFMDHMPAEKINGLVAGPAASHLEELYICVELPCEVCMHNLGPSFPASIRHLTMSVCMDVESTPLASGCIRRLLGGLHKTLHTLTIFGLEEGAESILSALGGGRPLRMDTVQDERDVSHHKYMVLDESELAGSIYQGEMGTRATWY